MINFILDWETECLTTYMPYSDYVYPFADLSVTGLTGPLVAHGLHYMSSYNNLTKLSKVSMRVLRIEVKIDILLKHDLCVEQPIGIWHLVG